MACEGGPRGRAAVIGAGSWGTALSLLAEGAGFETSLWTRRKEQADALRARGENATYLPGVPLPGRLRITADMEEAVSDAELVLLCVPSHGFRQTCRRMAGPLDGGTVVVSAAKGLEEGTLARMSEVLTEELPACRPAVLSGPSFASEVVRGDPTAVVVAAQEEAAARSVQDSLSTGSFRLYRNEDVVGVELGGAAKNVIAIAAGVVEGLELGSNTLAALITRGLAEIRRLALACGGRPETVAGLSGMGDLVLTCTGRLSRNRSVGVRLGRGERLREILGSMQMVAEGVRTTGSLHRLAALRGVEMPICEMVQGILQEEIAIDRALAELMGRSLKEEFEG